MLSELYIEDLALIEKAVIPFSSQFNVFTGETGAGKSILINGINAVLGQRTSKEIVRTGCEKAVITAMFRNLFDLTKLKLQEFGIDYSDDELTITREVYADGGSTARINNKPANISVVREIGQTLVNVHGQHDNQVLLSPDKHLDILDSYAEIGDELNIYQLEFKQLQDISRKLKALKSIEKDKLSRIELLQTRISEISKLNIEPNEDTQVDEEYNISKNSVEINTVIQATLQLFNGIDTDDGLVSQIGNAQYNLSRYCDIMSQLNSTTDRLNSVKIELEDLCSDLEELQSSTEYNAERFAYITERRQKLYEIKQKYGPSLNDVLLTLKKSQEEYDSLACNSDTIDELVAKRKKLLISVSEKAKMISEHRICAGKKFAEQVKKQLEYLDMPSVEILFSFDEGKLTLNGMDTAELLVSANVGEPPKPISKFASGGELSRIMLAIKNVLAEKDEVPTMIFDEIDTGVSGRAAQKIGIKLAEISKIRQVICVTHLSQIAVKADNHLLIEKISNGNRTTTNVRKLSNDERKYEIARILCGDNITNTTLKNAEELLSNN